MAHNFGKFSKRGYESIDLGDWERRLPHPERSETFKKKGETAEERGS